MRKGRSDYGKNIGTVFELHCKLANQIAPCKNVDSPNLWLDLRGLNWGVCVSTYVLPIEVFPEETLGCKAKKCYKKATTSAWLWLKAFQVVCFLMVLVRYLT